MLRKIFSLISIISLFFQQTGFAQEAVSRNLAGAAKPVATGNTFRPLQLRYLAYDNAKETVRVILDKGAAQGVTGPDQEEGKNLLGYFLVGITLPDSSFWVNLRPDAQDQIIDSWLGKTDVGRIMLETDLQLKKDTASFTSPRTAEGKMYWDKLYKKAEELYGTEKTDIPTLTRPWIVPGEIIVKESSNSVLVYKATLKVMLEQDYLKGSQASFNDERARQLNEYSSQLIRELIIPKLTREINTARRYAALRQVYSSLILSRWFKQRFTGKPGAYAQRIDSNNLSGITSKERWSKTDYFTQYRKSFSDGEYMIKEQVTSSSGQLIRSYFSGGIQLDGGALKVENGFMSAVDNAQKYGQVFETPAVTPRDILLSPVNSRAIRDGGSVSLPKVRVSVKETGETLSAEKVFSTSEDIDKISQWVTEIGTEPIEIQVNTSSWEFDAYTDDWLNGDVEVHLVFDTGSILIGKGYCTWPTTATFDATHIVQMSRHNQETKSLIFDLKEHQTEINQLKQNLLKTITGNTSAERINPKRDGGKVTYIGDAVAKYTVEKSNLPLRVMYLRDGINMHSMELYLNPAYSTQELAKYVLYEVYNRLTVFGAEEVVIDVEKDIYDEFLKQFNTPIGERGYQVIKNFMNIVYELSGGHQFRISHAADAKDFSDREAKARVYEPSAQDFRNLQGNYIGVDIGGSDIKIAVMKDGKTEYTKKENWSPETFESADEHMKFIQGLIDEATEETGIALKDMKALGISFNLVVVNNRPTGQGPVVNKLQGEELERIKGIAGTLGQQLGLPVYVVNDGDAGALWAAVRQNSPNTLALALGTGLAGGYTDSQLRVRDYMTEMGNIVLSLEDNALGHSYSQVPGAAQMYLSQRLTFDLAQKAGIDLSGIDGNANKLEELQKMFNNGDTRVIDIFTQVAQYMAEYVLYVNTIMPVNNLCLFGRVIKGKSGEHVVAKLQQIFAEQGVAITVAVPEGDMVEYAQAEGAAIYAAGKSAKPNVSAETINSLPVVDTERKRTAGSVGSFFKPEDQTKILQIINTIGQPVEKILLKDISTRWKTINNNWSHPHYVCKISVALVLQGTEAEETRTIVIGGNSFDRWNAHYEDYIEDSYAGDDRPFAILYHNQDSAIYDINKLDLKDIQRDGGTRSHIQRNDLGGIDFRALPMNIQPMGSFTGLNIPAIDPAQILHLNIDSEVTKIKKLVDAGNMPSEERINTLVAACLQKGKLHQHADTLLLCLIKVLEQQEEKVCETTPGFRHLLMILDSQ